MSDDRETDWFADGVVEDIITNLSHFAGLFVVARNSSFTYKGGPVDVKTVGRELGVCYVLEGSVRRGGRRMAPCTGTSKSREGTPKLTNEQAVEIRGRKRLKKFIQNDSEQTRAPVSRVWE